MSTTARCHLIISVTAVLIAALVVACGGSDGEPVAGTATRTSTPTPQPIVYEPITSGSECNAQAAESTLEGYYCWAVDVAGVLVIAGPGVDPEIVNTAAETVEAMLRFRADIREKMANAGAKLAIAGEGEAITDIPELRHLQNAALYDNREYEELGGFSEGVIAVVRLDGVGVLEPRPSGEPGQEDLVVHEFAHQIFALGITPKEWRVWRTLYTSSRGNGLWEGSYAGRNYNEFFAELTECYFGVNTFQENGINGADSLRSYDSSAASFLERVFGPR